MKTILFCLFFLFFLQAFSQVESLDKKPSLQTNKNDTLLAIEIIQPIDTDRCPLYSVNGQEISLGTLKTINPKMIDSIHVENKEIKLNGITYYGKISIKTKVGYEPQFISLNNIKLQYTLIRNEPVLFMIDDEFVKEDYDQYLVDLKYILKIIIDKIDLPDNKHPVNVIRLLTRSEENISKSKEIHLRGLVSNTK